VVFARCQDRNKRAHTCSRTQVRCTADHSGYNFIAYVLTILPHILNLQNNSVRIFQPDGTPFSNYYYMEYHPVKICRQPLFCKLKICGKICDELIATVVCCDVLPLTPFHMKDPVFTTGPISQPVFQWGK
jgi:hypothetical protein